MRLHGSLPAEVGSPAHADGLRAGVDRPLQAVCDRVDVARVDLERDALGVLVVRRPGGRDDRVAAQAIASSTGSPNPS